MKYQSGRCSLFITAIMKTFNDTCIFLVCMYHQWQFLIALQKSSICNLPKILHKMRNNYLLPRAYEVTMGSIAFG